METVKDFLSSADEYLPDWFYSHVVLLPVVLILLPLLLLFLKTLFEAYFDALKEKLKRHFEKSTWRLTLSITSVCLVIAAAYAHSYFSSVLLLLYCAYLWYRRFSWRQINKLSLLMVPLIAVIWWAELNRASLSAKRVCVVLATEEYGVGGRENVYELWEKTASALSDALSGSSLKIYPESLTEKEYKSLSIEKEKANVVKLLKRRGLYKGLLVENRAQFDGEKANGLITVVARLNLLRGDTLEEYGNLVTHKVRWRDVEYMPIATAADIVKELNRLNGYKLSEEEMAHVRHALVRRINEALTFNAARSSQAAPDAAKLNTCEKNETEFYNCLREYEPKLPDDDTPSESQITRRSVKEKLALARYEYRKQ